MSPVLQFAGDLGLLRLCTAAPHWVDPLARLAGAAAGPRLRLLLFVRATLPVGGDSRTADPHLWQPRAGATLGAIGLRRAHRTADTRPRFRTRPRADGAGDPRPDAVPGQHREPPGRRRRRRSAATMPTPMLRVCSRSARATSPTCRTRSKTGGGRPRRAVDASTLSSSGITRARLAARPPPVMCDIACVSALVEPAPGRPWRRSGSAPAAPRRGSGRARRRAGRGSSPRSTAARAGPGSSRWSAARTTPSRSPRRRDATRPGPSSSSASTTPVVDAGDVVLVRARAARGARRSRRRSARSRPRRTPRRCP